MKRVQDDMLKRVINLFRVSLLLLFLLSLSCQRERMPVAAVDPIQDITIVEDHSEVLVEWMKRGYKDMILVNIDQHDDLRMISDDRISKLKTLYDNKDWDNILAERDKGASSLYTLADFIHAAYRLGIINKLYWVSTSRLLESEDIEKGTRTFLSAFGYPDEVINTFSKYRTAVRGEIFGLEVIISTIKTLPEISSPVLLAIDSDYFSNVIRKTGSSELPVLIDFFDNLRKSVIEVRHLSISHSVQGDYTSIVDRHLVNEIESVLKNPDILVKNNFPPLWFIRDRGFGLLRTNQVDEAYRVFQEGLAVFKGEPSLTAGEAYALSKKGHDENALTEISRVIASAPGYDYMYITIAREAGAKGEIERAKRYINAYLRRHPDSFYALIAMGDIFYDNGKDEEALETYQRILAKGNYVSAVMYAGDTLVHLGRYRKAMSYYEKGVRLINDVGYKSPRDYPESFRNMNIIKAKGLVK